MQRSPAAHKGVTLQREAGKTAEHIQVIHRDLKPDNIFLVPTDLGEWVKILDFGVAKIRSDSSENTGITNITSTFIGTFRYAPPEQIQSDKNLDARGDIYSLGIILYEMLSAADPFGISIKGNQISEASWVLAHAYEPPKPLREQPGCENLPEQLEAVVMKCLYKNPANRFASVEELDRSLQAAAKFATDIHSVPGRAIVQPPRPLHNQGSNHETVSNDDTILRHDLSTTKAQITKQYQTTIRFFALQSPIIKAQITKQYRTTIRFFALQPPIIKAQITKPFPDNPTTTQLFVLQTPIIKAQITKHPTTTQLFVLQTPIIKAQITKLLTDPLTQWSKTNHRITILNKLL